VQQARRVIAGLTRNLRERGAMPNGDTKLGWNEKNCIFFFCITNIVTFAPKLKHSIHFKKKL